jgi:hypothetical protein
MGRGPRSVSNGPNALAILPAKAPLTRRPVAFVSSALSATETPQLPQGRSRANTTALFEIVPRAVAEGSPSRQAIKVDSSEAASGTTMGHHAVGTAGLRFPRE